MRARKGLFLAQKLPLGTDFSISPELRQMMELLQGLGPDDVDFDLEAERDLRELRARRGLND